MLILQKVKDFLRVGNLLEPNFGFGLAAFMRRYDLIAS
jgi:hypothetical protein